MMRVRRNGGLMGLGSEVVVGECEEDDWRKIVSWLRGLWSGVDVLRCDDDGYLDERGKKWERLPRIVKKWR
jgi:hypothetical protein